MHYTEALRMLSALGVGGLLLSDDDRLSILDRNDVAPGLLSCDRELRGESLPELFPEFCESRYDSQPYNIECRKYIERSYPDFPVQLPEGTRLMLIRDMSTQVLKFFYEDMFNRIDECVGLYDDKSRLMLMNDSALIQETLDRSEAIGRTLYELYPKNEEPFSTELALKNRRPVLNQEVHYTTFNKQQLDTINNAYPIFLNKELLAVVCIEENWPRFEQLRKKTSELQRELLDSRKIKHATRIKALSAKYSFDDILYSSAVMDALVKKAAMFARSDSSIVIYGETGTGKEMLAQSIHNASRRASGPFIAINCAAIPETLLESILFGTEKGAFTGAETREGLFEQANTGTLLLDEVNSMPPALQAKILRVLQESTIRHVGGIEEYYVDVRLISTTNAPLLEAVDEGKFRSDLYYRLNVISLTIPPLREHKEDIRKIVHAQILRMNRKLHKNIRDVSPDFLEALTRYDWPGNVRELDHAVEYAANLAPDEECLLLAEMLPQRLLADMPAAPAAPDANDSLNLAVSAMERDAIASALKAEGGNITRAAKRLGITRQKLQYRIKRDGIAL